MHDVYFDYAATTPVDNRVVEEMLPFFSQRFGNPNSPHALGRDACRALDAARERFAALIAAESSREVLLTGAGTESDNAALVGILTGIAPAGGAHLVVSAYEHHAVLEPARWLAKHGYEVTYLEPRTDGHVHADDLRAALRADTKLVSVMHGNNEIGALNDIRALAEVAHAGGALMHTDAVQTLGKVRFDVAGLGVDAASFSAHKIHGPKGVGALYLKEGTPFVPQLKGGGQEFKKRSGTQNVAGAVGFAKALELMIAEQPTEMPRLAALRDKLLRGVTSALENTEVTAPGGERLPNIAHLLVKGVEGEAMLLQLDAQGIAVSTGSACSSGSLEPSHVLLACGVPRVTAQGSLRLSIGRFTTEEEIDYFLEVFPPIVDVLRAMSPAYARVFGSATSS